MSITPYTLSYPQTRTSAVVVASPHSGRSYPAEFMVSSVLNELEIRSSEDAFVDLLLEQVPTFGAPLLSARLPRAYLDLNRAADELDPAVIADIPRGALNPRVSSGLGVIPRVVANGRAIYRGKISRAEAKDRIAQIWQPYHARLQELLDQSVATFGQGYLVDVHSMPHEAIESVQTSGRRPPQIVLGDRFGAACEAAFADAVEAAFTKAGFVVGRNSPFAGAFITQHYGRPSRQQHALQIEIDRSLYMDERFVQPNRNYDSFKTRFSAVMSEIVSLGQSKMPLAAE